MERKREEEEGAGEGGAIKGWETAGLETFCWSESLANSEPPPYSKHYFKSFICDI